MDQCNNKRTMGCSGGGSSSGGGGAAEGARKLRQERGRDQGVLDIEDVAASAGAACPSTGTRPAPAAT